MDPSVSQWGLTPLAAQSWWRRPVGLLGPDFTIFFFLLGVLLVVGHFFGAHYVVKLSTMLLPGLAAPGIILIRFFPRARAVFDDAPAGTSLAAGRRRLSTGARAEMRRIALGTLRDWLPLVLVATVFDNLENYTGVIRKIPIDDWLYRTDLFIFGAEPTVAIARLYRPLATDWFAFCYGIFFIVPMILGISLSLRGRGADFRVMATSVMLQMWLGFFLFICFPAGPPRYYEALRHGVFATRLPSLIGVNDWLQGTWDTYDPLLVRSSFPSLHCSYGLMTLIFAWQFGSGVFPKRPRLFFWIILPLELSLFVSTVYLRHHWIPDCVMGWTVAVTACLLAPWLWRRWPRALSPVDDRGRATASEVPAAAA
jgi:membrane-associated phospholipid phosphatase